MANLESWTAAARSSHSNSVVLAVPASSNPAAGGKSLEIGLEATVDGGVIGAGLGVVALAAVGVRSVFRRVQNRRRPVGEREVNDRVALLFYDDRVDVHRRASFRTSAGQLLASHSLDEVTWPEDEKLVVGGTMWILSGPLARKLPGAMAKAGIDLAPNEGAG